MCGYLKKQGEKESEVVDDQCDGRREGSRVVGGGDLVIEIERGEIERYLDR